MRKLTTFFVTASLIAGLNMAAQDLAFDKGKIVVTAGYGVPNLGRVGLRVLYGNESGYAVKGFGPMLLKGEYGIFKQLGVGAVLGFSSTSVSYNEASYYYSGNNTVYYNYRESLKWTSFTIGAHGNYHFVTKEKLDVYVGAGLGYNINSVTYTNNDPYNQVTTHSSYSPSAVYYAVTIGLRYYFTPNVGVYAEGGIDKGSLLQGGLALKF